MENTEPKSVMLASPHKEGWAPSTMLAFLEWNLRSRQQGPQET